MSPITRETLAERIATLEADSNISIKEGFYLQTMRLLLAEMDKPAPHHNGMMQLSNELAGVKEALRRLAAYARTYAGDIQYTGDHPIAVAEKLAGRELYGNAEQLDTAAVQFESLAGEHVSQPYKFPDASAFISEFDRLIDERDREIDAGQLGSYNYTALLKAASDAFITVTGNSPETPEGSMMLSPEGAQLLAEIIGGHAAVVTFLTMGRPDLALEESSKWVEGIDQAAEMVKAQEAKS